MHNFLKKISAIFLIISILGLNIGTAIASTSCSCSTIPLTLEITALYPYPLEGAAEWVEIRNTGGQAIQLVDYTLEDTTAKTMTLSGQISAGQSIKIEGLTFQLNNGGDTVTLKTSLGNWIDSLSYEASVRGEIIYKNSLVLAEENIASSESSSLQNDISSAGSSEKSDFYSTGKIPIISEVLPNPEGSDSTEEWIELYNPFNEPISLNGLYLDDEEGGSNAYKLQGNMAAESFLLIYIEESKISLNNAGDQVRILNENKNIISEISYEKADEGRSWGLVNGVYVFFTNPSPGTENINETAQNSEESSTQTDNKSADSEYINGDLSEEVKLSEVFPNPEGSDTENEWIEITNGGISDVNLGNWKIKDSGGALYIFPDNTIIHSGESLIIGRSESAIALNNSGELITLEDFTGETIDEISYENSVEDESYSKIEIEEVKNLSASLEFLGPRTSEIWTWTEPSPGKENPIWKQFKGEVTELEANLVTIFDGNTNWSFKTNEEALDKVIFQIGNTVLIRAAMAKDFYEVKDSELLESPPPVTKNSFPWEIVTGIFIVTSWLVVEYRKKRKMALS